MKHKGTVQLETPRLILRRLRVADAEAMYRNWANDPEVTKYLTWPPHESAELTAKLLGMWSTEYAKDDYYQWGIVLKEAGDEPIGSISVVNMSGENLAMATLGYCIGRNWWRRGIMTEALGAVIGFLFDEVGVNRIEAQHDANNPNSGAVMRKAGMQFEGTLRQAGWNNQGRCDVCQYAILRGDRA